MVLKPLDWVSIHIEDGLGMDVEFDNYDLESQELIH
jgi:hypothetical protein